MKWFVFYDRDYDDCCGVESFDSKEEATAFVNMKVKNYTHPEKSIKVVQGVEYPIVAQNVQIDWIIKR